MQPEQQGAPAASLPPFHPAPFPFPHPAFPAGHPLMAPQSLQPLPYLQAAYGYAQQQQQQQYVAAPSHPAHQAALMSSFLQDQQAAQRRLAEAQAMELARQAQHQRMMAAMQQQHEAEQRIVQAQQQQEQQQRMQAEHQRALLVSVPPSSLCSLPFSPSLPSSSPPSTSASSPSSRDSSPVILSPSHQLSASVAPSSSLLSLSSPPPPRSASLTPPSSWPSMAASVRCFICSVPVSANVSPDPGITAPPVRCLHCGQEMHAYCARMRKVDGEELCRSCRKARRRSSREERKEQKQRPQQQQMQEERKQAEQQVEETEEEGKETPRKKAEVRHKKSGKLLQSSRPPLPPLSLPSSSASSAAASAPPSSRSLTSASPASAHLEALTDFLSAFVNSFSAHSQHLIPYADRSSPHPLDWLTLMSRIRSCCQKRVLVQVDAALLAQLLPFLLSAMEDGAACAPLQPPEPLEAERVQTLLKALDGGLMTLHIMTQQGIERRLMRDEMLDGLVQLLTRSVKKILLPLYDPQLRDRRGKAADDSKAAAHPELDDNDGASFADDADDDDGGDDDHEGGGSGSAKKAKGKKKAPAAPPAASEPAPDSSWWKAAELRLKEAVTRAESLLRLLESYIACEVVADHHALPLIELCFTVFNAEHCTRLHLACLPLIVALFQRGDEARRSSILDSVVAAFRVAATRRLQRTFALQLPLSLSFRSQFSPLASGLGRAGATQQKAQIQILVALMMQLVHSVSAALPDSEQREQMMMQLLASPAASTSTSPSSSSLSASAAPPLQAEARQFAEEVRELHTGSQKASWYLVRSLLERLQPSAASALQFRHTAGMVRSVLDDLLLVLFLPEWPAAEQLLHCFVVAMSAVLDRPWNKEKTGMNSDRLHQLCLASVGLICQQVKAHLVQAQRAPLLIRARRSLDQSQLQTTPHQASEITDCICGYRRTGGGGGAGGLLGDDDEQPAEDDAGDGDAAAAAASASVAASFYLDCDQCHVWYHGACVGFSSEEEATAACSWVCESCLLREAVTQQKEEMVRRLQRRSRGFDPSDEATLQSGSEQADDASASAEDGGRASDGVLKQLLVNYLNGLAADGDAVILAARQFHLSQWLAAAVREEERSLAAAADELSDAASPPSSALASALCSHADLRLCLSSWAVPDKRAASDVAAVRPLSREGQFRLSRQLACSRELMLSIPFMLDKLLVKCTDPQPMFRAKAVTAVAGVVKVDGSILNSAAVKQALLQRVMDPSTSTREAVVELIGGQFKYQPQLLPEYCCTILARSSDVGISVRKRVVRIVQEILLHPALRDREEVQQRYTQLVSHLIERLRDEETVQRLVRDSFLLLWFDDSSDCIRGRRVSRAAIEQKDDRPDSSSSSAFSPAFLSLSRRVMDSVAAVSRTQSALDNLLDIVKQLMTQQDTAVKPKKGRGKGKKDAAAGTAAEVKDAAETADDGSSRQSQSPHSVRVVCADLCSCIVEQLVSHGGGDTASESTSPSPAFLQSAIVTLHFFARVHPPFLVPHAYTLQPYLKHHTDRSLHGMVAMLIDVFTELLPLVKQPSASFLEHQRRDLLQVIMQSSSLQLIASALPCLVVLTSVAGQRDILTTLVTRFHALLLKHQPRAAVRQLEQEGNVIRCLLSLGLLLKLFPEDAYLQLCAASALSIEQVFELYEAYIAHSPLKVQMTAIRGLIALFTRKPTLVTRSQAVIDRALGADSAPDLQLTTLQSLRGFLQSEDARLQRAQKIDQERTKAEKKKKSAATSGAAGDEAADGRDEEEDGGSGDELVVEELDAVNALHDFHGNKSWLQSRIEVSDFLPALIMLCERHVYALCSSPLPAVRSESLAFTAVFLQQAVTNPIDAMPTVISLLFDPQADSGNARQALAVLLSLADRKKEYLHFIEQRFVQGVRAGFALLTKLGGDEFDPMQARRQHEAAQSLEWDSVAQLYSLLKRSHSQRKQITNALINDVMLAQIVALTAAQPANASSLPAVPANAASTPPSPMVQRSPSSAAPTTLTSTPPVGPPSPASGLSADASSPRGRLSFLCFIASLIHHLPFEDDEPLHLLHHLSRIINTRAAGCLSRMDDLVQSIRDAQQQLQQEPLLPSSSSLLQSVAAQLSELTACCPAALGFCVLLHLRQYLIAAYQLEGRYEDWSISTATVKQGIRLAKRGDVPFSFQAFPWSGLETAGGGPQQQPIGLDATPQAAAKPSPAKRGSCSRRTTPQHSRSGSAHKGEGRPAQADSVQLIPAAVLAQYDFFSGLMSGSAVPLQAAAAAGGPGASQGRQKKKAAAVKRRRRADDDDEADSDDGEEAAMATPASTSAPRVKVRSSPRKPAAAPAAAVAAAAGHQRKKSRTLTFDDDGLQAEDSGGAEGAAGDDGDDGEDGEDSDWEQEEDTRRRRGGSRGATPMKRSGRQ